MSTGKHYFIEENQEGKFAVRAEGSQYASSLHDTEEKAIAEVGRLNPQDRPDIERARHQTTGSRDSRYSDC
ncbi:MAG TPA: DUF2188 domain-containing protein [Acidobacteriaceae bacterium]|jgi:hypothetical protein